MSNSIKLHFNPMQFTVTDMVRGATGDKVHEFEPNNNDVMLPFSLGEEIYTPTIGEVFELVKVNFQAKHKAILTHKT